jgi:hypothetical protein
VPGVSQRVEQRALPLDHVLGRLDHAVGVEHEEVPCLELARAHLDRRDREVAHPEREALGLQPQRGAALAQQQRRRMAERGEVQLPVLRLVDAGPDRGERLGLLEGGVAVQLLEQARESEAGQGNGAHGHGDAGGPRGRLDALADHVAHEDEHAPVGEPEDVVEVVTDAGVARGRLVADGQGRRRELRQGGEQRVL